MIIKKWRYGIFHSATFSNRVINYIDLYKEDVTGH